MKNIILQPIPKSEKVINYYKPIKEGTGVLYDTTHIALKQINCIASAMHYEASGEPLEGQIAVGELILNRVKSRRFKGTPCMVVAQKNQFSFVCHGNIPEVPEKKRKIMQNLAAKVVNREVESKVDGSLYFHATRVKPKCKLKKNGGIGNHVFYK